MQSDHYILWRLLFFRIRRLVLLYIFHIANKPHETTRINNVLVTV